MRWKERVICIDLKTFFNFCRLPALDSITAIKVLIIFPRFSSLNEIIKIVNYVTNDIFFSFVYCHFFELRDAENNLLCFSIICLQIPANLSVLIKFKLVGKKSTEMLSFA